MIKIIKMQVKIKKARIKIKDLPEHKKVSPEDLKKIGGGLYTMVATLPEPQPKPVSPLTETRIRQGSLVSTLPVPMP